MDKFEVYFGSRSNRSCSVELSVGLAGVEGLGKKIIKKNF